MNTDTSQQELFGHPKGLFYLFFAELWERSVSMEYEHY